MRWPALDLDAVVTYIRSYIATHGAPPHVCEISAAFGMGHKRTRDALYQLEDIGFVKRVPGARRRIWATMDYTPPCPVEQLTRPPRPTVDNRVKQARWLRMIAETTVTPNRLHYR